MSGLDVTGFTPKTLVDLLAEIKAAYQAALGTAINLGPRTPQGQVVANLSSELADLWQGLEDVYNSFYPDTASGVSLDQVVSITGLTRLAQSKSRVVVTVTGDPSTSFGILKGHVAGDTTSSFTALTVGETDGAGTVDIVFESDNYGPVVALAGTLTVLDTPSAGIDSITNVSDATEGRLTETDAELRLRRMEDLQRDSTCTVEGIRNSLIQNVLDVKEAIVIENPNDVADGDGRPPHSFEAVVDGGLDADVARQIWLVKAAGIQSYGSSSKTVTDSMGFPHTVNFTRPTPVDIYIDVELVKNTDPMEPPVYPADGDDAVAQALVDFFDAQKIGQDVVTSRLFVPVNTVGGILGIIILISTTPSPTLPDNISIAITERAVTDLGKITVHT